METGLERIVFGLVATALALIVLSFALMFSVCALAVIRKFSARRRTRVLDNLRQFTIATVTDSGSLQPLRRLHVPLGSVRKAALSSLYTEVRENCRGEVLLRCQELMDVLGVVDYQLRLLASGRPCQQVAAAEWLSGFGQARVVDALRAALTAKSPELRTAAAYSLAATGQCPTMELLAAVDSRGSSDGHARVPLFKELLANPDARSDVIALFSLSRRDSKSAMRTSIVRALARSGDCSHLAWLEEMARSESMPLRRSAREAILYLTESPFARVEVATARRSAGVESRLPLTAGTVH